MNKELLRVALRQQALCLPSPAENAAQSEPTVRVLAFVAELRKLGYGVSEPLLRALTALKDVELQDILDTMNDVMGTSLNWASLVRGWQVPTGVTVWDHFVTFMANVLREQPDAPAMEGTTLPCGHFIPQGTFPLERYNGCPYCGKPFHTSPGQVFTGQGTHLKVLQLWGDDQMTAFFRSLLESPVALDATQREQLKTLLRQMPLPTDVEPVMKETRMMVVDAWVERGEDTEAARFFSTPADVMRYLWYRHTGHVQLLKPRTLLSQHGKNQRYEWNTPDDIAHHVDEERRKLKLHYTRQWCRRVAQWLNGLTMPVEQQLETMHPNRAMWGRFIRALRLAEYARRPGFEPLQRLMDAFYRQNYSVWQGQVDRLLRQAKTTEALQLLQQRPGAFARCLFATMLAHGPRQVLDAFRQVADKVPPRLALTLGSQAELYFSRSAVRTARPLTGVLKDIEPQPLLSHYTDAQLDDMKRQVADLYFEVMRRHFALATDASHSTIYIDQQLYHIPVAVADRSNTIQDASAALQGMRFPVEGNAVRLFMQWGKGLPEQHLDMDLSCHILDENEKPDVCAYFNLTTQGAQHSGDIQRIPDQIGTAEYVELSLPELEKRGARHVVFTCNAYTPGAVSPNVTVGWMAAEHPMTVSNDTGVAYDPSTVQHMVRVPDTNLAKGLVFGVLEVKERQILWLEIPFGGQTVLSVDTPTIEAYLKRLKTKPTIGQVLDLKAEAQRLKPVATPDEADEVYTVKWAMNPAEVSRLLLS